MIITIDGPAASGKSTVGRLLAKQIGFYYLSSGLLFRALAYLLIENCAYKENNLRNPNQIDVVTYLDPKRFKYHYDHGKEIVLFDDQDITPKLKTNALDNAASLLSMNHHVREAIRMMQYHIAEHHDIVVEGRDSGSVVFPNATIKFFLTALPDVRAQRWQHEQQKFGIKMTFKEALNAINVRDKRDKERAIAPLLIPDDAIIIDNSLLTIKETLREIIKRIPKK